MGRIKLCSLLAVFLFVIGVLPAEATHEKIMFLRANGTDANDPVDIWIMNDDGSNQQELTSAANKRSDTFDPSWSRDGSSLAFGSYRDNAKDKISEVYTADVQVGNQDAYSLTNIQRQTTLPGKDDWEPTWSPNCRSLVFSSNRDTQNGTFELYLLDLDAGPNTPPLRLTNNTVDDLRPVWSPTANRIAFVRGDKIFVRNMENDEETQLTTISLADSSPAWHPAGNKIIFSRYGDNLARIWEMEATDTNHDGQGDHLTAITNSSPEYIDENPAYSPSGQKVAFSRQPSSGTENGEIWIRDMTLGTEYNLTNTVDKHELFPVWKPRPGAACEFLQQMKKDKKH